MMLILPDDPKAQALLAQRQGNGISIERGALVTLTPHLTLPYALILPGQHVRAFLTDVPETVRGAERQNVARFAHEDRLAVDPDHLHIVVGSGDPAPTLMVAKSAMEAWLTAFDPLHMFADFETLTDLTSDPVRLLDRVVTPGPQGDAIDLDWADGPAATYDDETVARAIFARLDVGDMLDLRVGAYRRRRAIQAGPWLGVAAAALVCGLLVGGLSLAQSRSVSAQAEMLRAQARTAYVQATGQAAPSNLARALRTATPTISDPTAFLTLSDRLFASLRAHSDIAIERLSFDAQENVLRLRLIYPDFEAAGALERTVADQGAVFVTGGVREQNGRFIGDASLSLGAGT